VGPAAVLENGPATGRCERDSSLGKTGFRSPEESAKDS
jgi:hypothetical protein